MEGAHLQREADEVGAGLDVEILYQAGAVRVDDLDAEADRVGDLLIRLPLRDFRQNLPLTVAQGIDKGCVGRTQDSESRVRPRLTVGGVDEHAPCGDGADRDDQFGVRGALDDVPSGSHRYGAAHISRIVVHRRRDDVGSGCGTEKAVDAGAAQAPGHREIERDDVGVGGGSGLDRLGKSACFTDDLNVGLGADEHPEPAPEQGMIVNDEDASAPHAVAPIVCSPEPLQGSWMRIAVPRSGAVLKRMEPPTSTTTV